MSNTLARNLIVLNGSKSTLLPKIASTKRCYSFANASVSSTTSLRGIFPQVSTPFKAVNNGGRIAWNNLEKNLVLLEESHSFPGYVLNGFFGEGPHLNFAERTHVVKLAKKIVRKKKTLIVSTFSDSLQKLLLKSEQLANSGANYILLDPPHFHHMQMKYSTILQFYTRVADKSPVPILLNNMHTNSLIDIPAELCIDLAHHPNIVGLQESSVNIPKISQVCEETRGQDFGVLAGSAHFLLDSLQVGAIGGTCALASVLGSSILEIYEAHEKLKKKRDRGDKSGLLAKAKSIQEKLVEPDLLINHEYGVPALKAAMDAFGQYGGPCRQPLLELNSAELDNLKAAFEGNGFAWNDTSSSWHRRSSLI